MVLEKKAPNACNNSHVWGQGSPRPLVRLPRNWFLGSFYKGDILPFLLRSRNNFWCRGDEPHRWVGIKMGFPILKPMKKLWIVRCKLCVIILNSYQTNPSKKISVNVSTRIWLTGSYAWFTVQNNTISENKNVWVCVFCYNCNKLCSSQKVFYICLCITYGLMAWMHKLFYTQMRQIIKIAFFSGTWSYRLAKSYFNFIHTTFVQFDWVQCEKMLVLKSFPHFSVRVGGGGGLNLCPSQKKKPIHTQYSLSSWSLSYLAQLKTTSGGQESMKSRWLMTVYWRPHWSTSFGFFHKDPFIIARELWVPSSSQYASCEFLLSEQHGSCEFLLSEQHGSCELILSS